MKLVILRDTISGQPLEVDEKTAERYMKHPVWSKRLEYARVAKPEVLAHPSSKTDEAKKPAKKTEDK